VGVATIYLVNGSRYEDWGGRFRTLPTEIWYPSTGQGGHPNTLPEMIGELPDWVMSVLKRVFGDGFDELWGTTTTAFRDAEPLFADAPYPVFFFSHGFMGLRFQNYTTCERLASHGIACVAVDHYGNAIFTNLSATAEGGIVPYNPRDSAPVDERVEDARFVFNELTRINQDAAISRFGLFDVERFAVGGHSLGGLTILRGGAEFDFVKAIAPLNPVPSDTFPDDFDLPFFLLQGAKDAMIGEAMNAEAKRLFVDAPSRRKVFLNVLRGGHFSTTDVCTLVPPILNSLAVECLPPFIDSGARRRVVRPIRQQREVDRSLQLVVPLNAPQ
jgi:predicted dienelactone hydrolase